MSGFIGVILRSLEYGSIYALASLSIILVYKTSFTTNFAQGVLGMFNTYLIASLVVKQGMKVLTNSSVGYDVRDKLKEINCPTMILSCEYDFVTPTYQQKELHDNIKNSQLVFVPDSGHNIMYEKPALFTSVVLDFFTNKKEDFIL